MIVLPSLLSRHVSGFHLTQQFQASSKGSVLAIASFPISPSGWQMLAVAGHGGGYVRFWTVPPSPSEGCPVLAETANVHGGSVFALDRIAPDQSSGVRASDEYMYLVSGSFDRTAKLHRVIISDRNDVTMKTVGDLAEHTGWVRGVRVRTSGNQYALELSGKHVLSIGCNLINVWTVKPFSDQRQGFEAVRIARLDAGPSPGDPCEEDFRRHDILCLDLLGDGKSVEGKASSWIVAGLVDGTVRVFEGRFDHWQLERFSKSPYSATGNCAVVEDVQDDRPTLAFKAHSGGVTGVHKIPGSPQDFISLGHDGRWVRWHIAYSDAGVEGRRTPIFAKEREGRVPAVRTGTSEVSTETRIISSSVVTDINQKCSLVLGTTGGSMYQVDISSKDASACKEIWKDDTGKNSITSIATLGSDLVAAGTSAGSVMVFQNVN